MKIKIIKKIEDLNGQYEAIYLSNPISVIEGGTYGGEIKVSLNTGDKIVVDVTPVIKRLHLEYMVMIAANSEIICEGIFSIYSKNPSKGAVLTITKLL